MTWLRNNEMLLSVGIQCDKIRESKLVRANVSAETGESMAVIFGFFTPTRDSTAGDPVHTQMLQSHSHERFRCLRRPARDHSEEND